MQGGKLYHKQESKLSVATCHNCDRKFILTSYIWPHPVACKIKVP